MLASVPGMLSCQLGIAATGEEQAGAQAPAAPEQSEPSGLVIENSSELPDTYPHGVYEVRFRAHGGVSATHWRLVRGSLPDGLQLEADGLLHGQAERNGEFQFTLRVSDNQQPPAQKDFVINVRSALTLKWKAPATVNGNRIEGSAEVSNTTPNDMDLTFVVLAVAENGRATAIGYQHFLLRGGTVAKELPFGETLPNGGYVVHVDAIGEVAAKKWIYRDRLQTPSALKVTVGP